MSSTKTLLLLGALFGTCLTNSHAQPQPIDPKPKVVRAYTPATISVIGEGYLEMEPDKALISLSINTTDQTLLAAKQKNNDALKELTDNLRLIGIKEPSLQVGPISVEHRAPNSSATNTYIAKTQVLLPLANPKDLEAVIGAALEEESISIKGTQLLVNDELNLQQEVRSKALKVAKEKASKMAATLNQKLGNPILITEVSNSSEVPPNKSKQESSAEKQTELGKVPFKATVSVSFEMLPE